MIAGIGFRDAAGVASLLDALTRAGAPADCPVALPAAKAAHPAARALAARGHALLPVAAAVLRATETLTESAASRRTHQTGSVAEACALAAARAEFGAGARLVAPRAVSADRLATAALAGVLP